MILFKYTLHACSTPSLEQYMYKKFYHVKNDYHLLSVYDVVLHSLKADFLFLFHIKTVDLSYADRLRNRQMCSEMTGKYL